MKSFTLTTLLAVLLALPATAADMGTSFDADLDALWATAQADYQLDQQDAVLLLESRDVTIGDDGAVATRIHRVVWIGSSVGLRRYADLRVPWNSATSTLEVQKLRTWREDRWWPDAERLSDTAVVETLPYAMRRAADYTDQRETMLLHDGVELPCIMETAYTITERGRPAADDVFILAQTDPAVRVTLRLTLNDHGKLHHAELNSAPAPAARLAAPGTPSTVTWSMEHVPARLQPQIPAPETYEPAVAWSTWPSWQTLAETIDKRLRDAAHAGRQSDASLTDKLHDAATDWSRVRTVAAHLNETVREVHYDTRWWTFSPRPAQRTLETAYGHTVDRAVAALALLQQAGLKADLLFVPDGNRFVAGDVPRLSGLGEMLLVIHGEAEPILLDPAHGTVHGFAHRIGHPRWQPGDDKAPAMPATPPVSRLAVSITLEPGDDGWQGHGYVYARGVYNPHGRSAGLDNEFQPAVENLVRGVLPSAELAYANPELFNQGACQAGFGLETLELTADDHGRTRVVAGDPGDGVLGRLGRVRLYEDERESPVTSASVLGQQVALRIKTEELELIQVPAAFELKNAAGVFRVAVQQTDDWTNVTRELTLASDRFDAAIWPELRALLLAAEDLRHRTIVWR